MNRDGMTFACLDRIVHDAQTMPRKRPNRHLDVAQSAATILAVTAATDEEFAAGLPFSDPGAILVPKSARKRKRAKKR